MIIMQWLHSMFIVTNFKNFYDHKYKNGNFNIIFVLCSFAFVIFYVKFKWMHEHSNNYVYRIYIYIV